MFKKLVILSSLFLCGLLKAQDKRDDILILSSADSVEDIVVYTLTHGYLSALIANTPGIDNREVDLHNFSAYEADGTVDFLHPAGTQNGLIQAYYAKEFSDGYVLDELEHQYQDVILINFNEHSNRYPEMHFEGVKRISEVVLKNGGTPYLLMDRSGTQDTPYVTTSAVDLLETTYRVANGVGIEAIPAGMALSNANLDGEHTNDITAASQAYIMACSVYYKITGLHPNDITGYNPTYNGATALTNHTSLANQAVNTLDTVEASTRYNTSSELDNTVVYRTLNYNQPPFNVDANGNSTDRVIRYERKGTSTENGIDTRIKNVLNSANIEEFILGRSTTDQVYTSVTHGRENGGTREWLQIDSDREIPTYYNGHHDSSLFLYARGAEAPASELKANQANLLPFTFNRPGIYGPFLTPDINNGLPASTDFLINSFADSNDTYHEYGWNHIPTYVGIARLQEKHPNLVASSDGEHFSTPLYYLAASMLLTSGTGLDLPLPDVLVNGNNATQINAFYTGQETIKELAFLSETGDYVPDSDLSITNTELLEAKVGEFYSHTLNATGGDGNYTWAALTDLPTGLSLSNNGVLSGSPDDYFAAEVAFKVTDGNGALRKIGLKFYSSPPETAEDLSFSINSLASTSLTLPNYPRDPSRVTYSITTPSEGSLTGTAPDLTYSPLIDFITAGVDHFNYTLTVDGVELGEATVTLNYDPAGVASAGSLTGYHLSGSDAANFRSASQSDHLDLDGDDRYGTAGYYFIGNGTNNTSNTNGTPTWVNSVSHANAVVGAGYTHFNDPTVLSGSIVTDWTSTGLTTNRNDNAGAWANLLSFEIDHTAPSFFRLGILAGNEANTDGRWDPSGIQVTYNGVSAEVTDLEITDLGIVFFDVTVPAGLAGTIQVSGQTRDAGSNSRGPSLAGIIFDEPALTGLAKFLASHGVSISSAQTADSDRLSGLLEYVLNGDPTVNDGSDISPLITQLSSTDTYHFTRRIESTEDTTQTVQYSHNLVTWEDIIITGDSISPKANITPHPTDSELEEVAIDVATLETEGKIFMQLKVEAD